MRRLFRDIKGAVTVFVTILLIPTVIVSGTFVDLARAYASRSILENASFMGANAAISGYDNLLKDMYGLFAYLKQQDDEKLNSLIQEYVAASLFGKKDLSKGGGVTAGLDITEKGGSKTKSFTFLLGERDAALKVTVNSLDSLREPTVIRNQINEYMKFRGPVVAVTKFLDFFDGLGLGSEESEEAKEQRKNMEAVSELYDDKNNPAAEIAQLLEKYKNLYKEINEVSLGVVNTVVSYDGGSNYAYRDIEGYESFSAQNVHHYLYSGSGSVKQKFAELRKTIKEYESLSEPADQQSPEYAAYKSKKEELEKTFNKARDDAHSSYGWALSQCDKNKKYLSDQLECLEKGIKICKEIKDLKIAINRKLGHLEEILKGHYGDYTDESKYPEDTLCGEFRNFISSCRKLMEDAVDPILAYQDFSNQNRAILEKIKKLYDDEYYEEYTETYKDKDNPSAKEEEITIPFMKGVFPTTGLDRIGKWKLFYEPSESEQSQESNRSKDKGDWRMPNHLGEEGNRIPEFVSYEGEMLFRFVFNTKNREIDSKKQEFYKKIKEIYHGKAEVVELDEKHAQSEGGSKGKDPEERQRNSIITILKEVQKVYDGCFTNKYDGAQKGPYGGTGVSKTMDITDPDQAGNLVREQTSGKGAHQNGGGDTGGILDMFNPEKLMNTVTDRFMLLTYGSTMFSNYITGKPVDGSDENSKKEPIFSLTGVKMSPDVNYFYQSEWEYLYHGNQDAEANLKSVTAMLFLVRILYNTALSFTVSEVNTIVRSITISSPFGVVLGPLARAAFILGESAIDVATLRNGGKLPLIKTAKEWKLKPSGAVQFLAETAKNNKPKEEKGLDYSNYLMLMLLFLVSNDDLERRIGDLIELNVNNYKSISVQLSEQDRNLGEGERKQKIKEQRQNQMAELYRNKGSDFVDLSKSYTVAEVESAVKMRMLFLSIPLAENYAKKHSLKLPAKYFPIRAKVRRGY